MAAGLNYTVFDFPNNIPVWLLWYPAFNICRIFYHISIKCGYEVCLQDLSKLPDELVTCIIILYVSAFIYIFLGIYLYEVIPQQFGIRKSPFFCIKPLINKLKCNKKKVDKFKGNENIQGESLDSNLASDKDKDIEIGTNTDEEISNELNKINILIKKHLENLENNSEEENSNKNEIFLKSKKNIDISIEDLNNLNIKDFPLVVSNLSKQYDDSKASTIDNDRVVRKKALNNLNLLLSNNEIFGLLG